MVLYAEDYLQSSVEDFDSSFKKYQDGYTGYLLDDPLLEFKQSLFYAKIEIIAEEDGVKPELVQEVIGDTASMTYQIQWNTKDKSTTTVAERNNGINLCIDNVNAMFSQNQQAEMQEIQETLT